MRRATELRTERLRMRRVRGDDLDAIHGIMSDPGTMRFWSSPPHATRAETERWLASMIEADRTGQGDEFVLEHRGVVIGKLGVWRLPEIGFFLCRDCWGLGLATEALQRFISYARGHGVECLTADVDPRNSACLRLLAKCGFIETGRNSATYVVAGQPCDSVYLRRELSAPESSTVGRDR
jgi:[ribosomal protein S5]-alanine N-acetyltransferase